jgi:hypothetical protein
MVFHEKFQMITASGLGGLFRQISGTAGFMSSVVEEINNDKAHGVLFMQNK